MIRFISGMTVACASLCLSFSLNAQTAGTLTFQFTQTQHSSYSGTKNVMAVWIQDAGGNFVKTRTRNAGGGTSDHLPTWAVNSGGSASNCMSSACNIVGATTGATLTNFSTRTVTWDGTDVSGNVVPDGTYKITIQSTWNHGSSGTTTRSFTFTKGSTVDSQTPANDGNFTNITLDWAPTSGLEENENVFGVNIHPNPSEDGVFNVDYVHANSLKVFDVMGAEVLSTELSEEGGSENVDLSKFPNGVYFIHLSDGNTPSVHKVVKK